MSKIQNNSVIIIGAGIAGISAAIHALDHNLQPIIIDKNRYIGGRVRSFYAKDIGKFLDNGQHILASAYSETRQLLSKIGSLDKVFFQKEFTAQFIGKSGKVCNFKTYLLPAPFHFLLPLLIHKSITGIRWRDLWNIIGNRGLTRTERFQEMTLETWLDICKQGKAISDFLWEPLALSILNTPLKSASAYLLHQAILKSFLGPRNMSGMGIPLDWLSDIFADPAADYFKKNNCDIHLLNQVQKIVKNRDQTYNITTQKESFSSKYIVCTTPPFALSAILENSQLQALHSLKERIEQFVYNPIITINIYLNEPLPGQFPTALVASPIQWVFIHPTKDRSENEFGYALVCSAANDYSEYSHEELLEIALTELNRTFKINLLKTHHLSAYKVLREKRATISQTPQSLKLRPSPETALPNFYLAGDWIDTGLPATIEGAVLSGKMAIETLIKKQL